MGLRVVASGSSSNGKTALPCSIRRFALSQKFFEEESIGLFVRVGIRIQGS